MLSGMTTVRCAEAVFGLPNVAPTPLSNMRARSTPIVEWSRSTGSGCAPVRGMAVARAQGKLKGRQPKLSPMQQRELRRMHQTGEYTVSDLGELFSASRPTMYRTVSRTSPEKTGAFDDLVNSRD